MAEEKQASGISPTHTELDDLVEEIIQKEELSEELRKDEGEAQKKKKDEDKLKAIDMRKKAMESFSETSKRQADDEVDVENTVVKRRRSGGSETVQFLREKNEKEFKIRENELELQREVQENERKRYDALMQMMVHQQQQQQQQQQQMQQQFQMMMSQQANLLQAFVQKMNKS